ncbi:MAG: Hpt domain-containing protein [Bdellovibrio bacteriovorus]
MNQERWHIPTCDEELVDIFLEEVGELLQHIDNHLKAWTSHPGDQQSLTEIRRCFHTLKGSGRMVKALDLSELAWKLERMLNQALAGAVQVSEPMLKVVAAARAQIPKMVDAFKNRRPLGEDRDILTLMRLADTLAAGKASPTRPTLRAIPSATEERPARAQEIHISLSRCMQRADEALHRSELALQQARRTSALLETTQRMAGQPETGGEVTRLRELVERLANEVSELRLRSEQSQRESALRHGELNQRVEQRVRAQMAPSMERLRDEIQQEMEERHLAERARRRFGWLALILSALIGGLVASALILSTLYLG